MMFEMLTSCGLLAETLTMNDSVPHEPMKLDRSMATVAYIAAAVLFVFSLGGLSHQESARRGNVLGIIGMLLAIVATVFGLMQSGYVGTVIAIVPAVVIGAILAARVPMTGMPELVAMLHSFVGLAAVLVRNQQLHSAWRLGTAR